MTLRRLPPMCLSISPLILYQGIDQDESLYAELLTEPLDGSIELFLGRPDVVPRRNAGRGFSKEVFRIAAIFGMFLQFGCGSLAKQFERLCNFGLLL